MKLKKLFGLPFLFFSQTFCMDFVLSEGSKQCVLYVPHDVILTIVQNCDIKSLCAFKRACKYFNEHGHYWKINPLTIQAEDINLCTNGLIHFAHQGQNQSFELFMHNESEKREEALELLGLNKELSIEESMNVYRGSCSATIPAAWNMALDNDIVLKILSSSLNPNIQDARGNTALHVASVRGKEQVVKLLLNNKNIEPDIENNDNITALYVACSKDFYAIVKLLIENKKTNLNMSYALPGLSGSTPLHLACHAQNENMVRILLDQERIDPNVRDNNGLTPLYLACLNNDEELVELLLSHERIDPNIENNDNITALYVACSKSFYAIVKLLIENKKINLNMSYARPDLSGSTPLHLACLNNDEKLVELLLSHERIDPNIEDNDNMTALYVACSKSFYAIVKLLIENKKTNLNMSYARPDLSGSTPLHLACINNDEKLVELLLSHERIDPNVQNNNGLAPLHFACFNNYEKLVELLLSHERVNFSILDNNGGTPFDIVSDLLTIGKGSSKIEELFLKKMGKFSNASRTKWTMLGGVVAIGVVVTGMVIQKLHTK